MVDASHAMERDRSKSINRGRKANTADGVDKSVILIEGKKETIAPAVVWPPRRRRGNS